MPYVYSTLSCDQAYSVWEKTGNDIPVPKRIVTIKGGNSVAGKNLITPRGVATFVTDQQLEALEKCDAFKRHKDRGYLRVDKQEMAPEKAVASLNSKDESAPLTPETFEAEGKKAPKTGKVKASDE